MSADKSRVALLIYSSCFGFFGADRFYLGQTGAGLAKIVASILSFGIYPLIELLIIIKESLRSESTTFLSKCAKFPSLADIDTAKALSFVILLSLILGVLCSFLNRNELNEKRRRMCSFF
jgi:TM2 domain-containing membrane protein YozV